MNPPSGAQNTAGPSGTTNASGIRTSTLNVRKVIEQKEEVDEISSIGPSGIVGFVNPPFFDDKHRLQYANILRIASSTKEVKKKKQIIIPLIKHEFGDHHDTPESKASDSGTQASSSSQNGESATNDSKQPKKDDFEGIYGLITTSESRPSQSKAPMLARSRPKGWRDIEDEDQRLKFEIEARPEEDVSAYERVPIADFGKAMLLGMGWQPGVNDGVKVLELQRRPERLGLGATPKQPPPDPKKAGSASTASQSRQSSNGIAYKSPFLEDGARVAIIAGEHHDMLGRIRRLSHDQKEYIVDLDNDEQVRVRIKDVEKYDSSKKRPSSNHPSSSAPQSKRYQTAEIVSHSAAPQYREEVRKDEKQLWVTPFIRVKVQSKRFKDGKYYCKKGVVEDIVTGTRCAVRLDDGQVIDDIDQSDLETVIPSVGGRIMVVRGPDIGVRGILKEKDFGKEVVYIQIENELNVLKFNMDDVSEYVE